MTNTAWHDLDVRGRMMAALIKQCNTKFYTELDKGNYDIALSFLDRIIKTEHVLQPYVETYNGVQKFMRRTKRYESAIPLST